MMNNHKFSFVLLILVSLIFQLTACAQEPKAETVKPSMTHEQIAAYIRKAFNVPSNVTITVTENAESTDIPGTYPVLIQFKGDRVDQKQEAWITKESTLIVGRTFDMTVDPYKKNQDKINLANVPVTGASDAKVTIVEYSDFQCPYCSSAHVTVKNLLSQYQGKVKVAYKHLPLQMHNWAKDAAEASVCVHKQNPETFWKLSDYFFTNQKAITKETFDAKLQEFASQNGVNAQELKTCMADPATEQKVEADAAEAGSLGLSSTPSFIVNGRTVVGAIPVEQFKQIIDEALKTAQ
jgi:protein-disulfide isomerase